jgi:transcriptional regulator with XRE-family HTH domain
VDPVRKLITDKLAETGLTMKEVSTKLGRNESYLHQFLKRGHPAELGERDRGKLAHVLGISPDDLRGPDNPMPPRLNGHAREETGAIGIEDLQDRSRIYERALRKIAAEQPNSTAAEIARAALRLFE